MIRVKENKKSLKGLKGYYAYSHVDEYVVADTYLDDEWLIYAVTYCQLPDVDSDGEFNAFNTYRDTIDYYDEYGDDIIIYTKEEVGEIIKTLQYIYNGYSENIKGGEWMNNKLWWWFVFCYLSFPCSVLLIWIVGGE